MSMKGYIRVGKIPSKVARLAGFTCNGDVFACPGVYKHIVKKHAKQLGRNIIENLTPTIKSIISSPDFIGQDPKKGCNSIELVKYVGVFMLLGLEVDPDEGYIYVASLYPITEGKICSRLYNGRFIAITSISKFKQVEKKLVTKECFQ
ncbi:hypothetical protein [Inconstantimicrobium mannanitabidum]|uniref:Uncharacterized protein n=1 Tax=Inconstantimicrobium mannanitabidum TaxID=1604901 RepID=A0ACB5RII9_9CLOT|nr:hypothetical protein [Clostridium sp. TW13]GKX68899.1 hypothetical protein rsdtw13_41570 [Clostridium sp. TW13]